MIKVLTLIIFTLFLSGCAKQVLYPANYPGLTPKDNQEQTSQTPVQTSEEITQNDENPQTLDKLYAEYKKWHNTPYRFGSTGMGGTDCSGFVQAIYKDAFNLDIPRDSSNQVLKGSEVKTTELKPGDLVFFKINAHLRHVGIYVGKNSFMHSATRGGVMLSSMNDSYWKQKYWTSRRMLSEGRYTAQN